MVECLLIFLWVCSRYIDVLDDVVDGFTWILNMESGNVLIKDYMLTFWDWNTGAWVDERVKTVEDLLKCCN